MSRISATNYSRKAYDLGSTESKCTHQIANFEHARGEDNGIGRGGHWQSEC